MNFNSILLTTVMLCVMRVNGLSHSENSSFSGQLTDKCDLTARPQCSSDCSKILACVSRIETPILSVNCSGSTPYCENGRCVATPGKCVLKMKARTAPFLCTSSGVFPEPTDCSKSHSCSSVGAQSIISLCSSGEIFDSKLKLCVRRPSDYKRICEKISCDGVTNGFVSFPANPTFYAYCFTSATGMQHTYMYKCDDETNKIFDVNSKRCRFNCKAIGYYADPVDCSSYYICNGLKFASRHVHCPSNYYFNGTVCLNSTAHCPAGSIDNVTNATSMPMIDDNFMADEMHSATEEVATDADTTSLFSSESSPMETSTTPEPTTMVLHDSSTKKPSIWKHMGLISVRVGRFHNIV